MRGLVMVLVGAALMWVGKQTIPEEGWFVVPGAIVIVVGLLRLLSGDS